MASPFCGSGATIAITANFHTGIRVRDATTLFSSPGGVGRPRTCFCRAAFEVMSSSSTQRTGVVRRDVRTFKLLAVWNNRERRIVRPNHNGPSDSMNALATKQPQHANPVKHQELILDAIDQLRHRKARPDAERIYNSLFRRHSISCIEAKIALEKCVESGVVLRVAYKGNISYRNAAKKYSHLKRNAQGEIIRDPSKPRRKFNELLTNAFGDLVMQDPDYLQLGVPPNELIRTMLSKDPARYSKRYLSIVLDKEVETGGLIKMENGNFLVGPSKNDRCQLPVGGGVVVESNNIGGGGGGNSDDTNALTTTTTTTHLPHKLKKKTAVPKPCFRKDKFMEAVRSTANPDDRRGDSLRVGGRRKRAKKVFDPSDNNLPKKRGRPNGSLSRTPEKPNSIDRNSDSDSRPESRNSQNGRDQGGVCSVCHFQIKKGPNDRMVSCRECSNKAHASCLNGDDMMLKMYLDNSWQCPHCKTCTVCYETSDAGYLAVCSICADAYHMGCHDPKLTERLKPGAKWLCANCQMPEQLVVDHIQIGYNMEAAMKVTNNHNDDTQSHSPELSRNSTPTSATSPPPSPTPPTLSPQNTSANNGGRTSISESDKSDTQSLKEEELDENIDPSIPDARHWSAEDVYNYFSEYFPEEAPVFKEQEIDGRSLLLMKRMDVLKGLCLKLGPALKIYRHVLKLQYRRDDPKLYWA